MSTQNIEITLRWMNDVVEVRRIDVSGKDFSGFTVGTLPTDDLFVPLAGRDSHALLMRSHDGRVYVEPLGAPLCALEEDAHIVCAAGPFSIEVRAGGQRALAPWLPSFDGFFANVTTATMSVTAALVALLVLAPATVHAMPSPLPVPRALSILRITPPPVAIVHPPSERRPDRADAASEPRAPRSPRAGSANPRAAVDVNDLFGDAAPSGVPSASLEAWRSALKGGARGGNGGENGLASRDLGGPVSDSVHIGGLRVSAEPGADEPCDGCLGKHQERVIDVVEKERPEIHGPIDKEIIRRVVREHTAHIRACYESELQAHPGLKGKAVLAWTISADGHVLTAHSAESDMPSAVGNCMAGQVKTWKFPKLPPGANTVIVKYPFLFKAS